MDHSHVPLGQSKRHGFSLGIIQILVEKAQIIWGGGTQTLRYAMVKGKLESHFIIGNS